MSDCYNVHEYGPFEYNRTATVTLPQHEWISVLNAIHTAADYQHSKERHAFARDYERLVSALQGMVPSANQWNRP